MSTKRFTIHISAEMFDDEGNPRNWRGQDEEEFLEEIDGAIQDLIVEVGENREIHCSCDEVKVQAESR